MTCLLKIQMEMLKSLAIQGLEPQRGLIANRVSRVFVLIGTQVILDIIEDGYIMVFLAFARKCLNSVLETHLKFFASYAKFGDSWRENIVR